MMEKNSYFGNQFAPIIQNPINQNIFLQKKRFLENPNLNYINNIQQNEFQENNQIKYDFTSELKRPTYSFCDSNYNQNEHNKIINNFSTDIKNKIENYLIITNINNVNNNLIGNLNNDFLNNNYKLNNYNNKEYINVNDNFNENNNNLSDLSKLISLSNNSSNLEKKNNYFNVTHNKKKRGRKIIKNNINQTENNNEIKVLKNNKVVYVNTFLLNSYSTSKNIKKFNKIAFIGRNKRSSRYRGVSKNGNQWQVLMMINKSKSYIGSYPSEELAARIYDILALKNRGIKARTNFIYNSKQIKKICEMEIDIKSENISGIISQLIE